MPRQPQSESEFKRAYANVALAAGLNKQQIVRIYSFEAGGNGGYDVQAGLEHNKSAPAITTALGYNQLLATNSVEVVAESGPHFVKALAALAATLPGPEKTALEGKIAILRKMVAVARSVPDAWNEHQALAGTTKGLAIHALNLDVDIGPYLQTQKLLDSVVFARRKGYTETLTAAELEMMNLTGDGNGFDMITMSREWRARVPTALTSLATDAYSVDAQLDTLKLQSFRDGGRADIRHAERGGWARLSVSATVGARDGAHGCV